MITVYGISNCDTVKKALRWLEQHAIEYRFHDVRRDGLDPALVKQWLQELGWEALINRRSTSWKALSSEARDTMSDRHALQAILDQPTLIKRPLLDIGHERRCGFSAPDWESLLLRHTL